MKCAFPGCPGEYEDKSITHEVRQPDGVAYVDNVPAKVCTLCGDTIIAADVMARIDKILKGEIAPNP